MKKTLFAVATTFVVLTNAQEIVDDLEEFPEVTGLNGKPTQEELINGAESLITKDDLISLRQQ